MSSTGAGRSADRVALSGTDVGRIAVGNVEVLSFQQFLRTAGVPCEGYDPIGHPDSRWHRMTISSWVSLNPESGCRQYVKLGYCWLPTPSWPSSRVHAALLATYTTSFLIEDDSAEEHRDVSERSALPSTGGPF